MVFKGSGSGFASNVTAGGGRLDLTAQWTIVWRIPEAFGSECVGGGCGRPWKQDATGTGSITGSRSPEENCSGSLHSNSDFLANRLTGDQIQFIAKSPMEYGGELQTAGSCPASGGYLLEGTGLARTRPESLTFIRSTFGVPLVTRVGGGPGPAPSFNPQSVSWSGTMTIINGTCGDVCSAPGPSTPEAVRDFARRAWRSVIPEYMLIFAFDSIEFSLLDSTPLFFSLLHVPTSGFDALSQALQAYIDGSNLFYKLYFLPIVNETFTTMINTLTALEKAFNDPPLPGYRRPAPVASLGAAPRFPPCNVAPRGATPFCRRLVASATDWLTALHGTESLINALAIDVGRESGADNAGNRQAARRLGSAELRLLPRIRASLTRQRAAGRQLANTLRSIRFDPRLDATQVSAALPQVLADLAKRGVSASDIMSILSGRSILPRALDLENLLAASWG